MDDSTHQLATATHAIACPYCGEQFDIVVDLSVWQQSYIEDCYVCCRPIHLDVSATPDSEGGSQVSVVARSENEC